MRFIHETGAPSSTFETRSQFPPKSSFHNVILEVPAATASTLPVSDQLTVHTGSSKSCKQRDSYAPPTVVYNTEHGRNASSQWFDTHVARHTSHVTRQYNAHTPHGSQATKKMGAKGNGKLKFEEEDDEENSKQQQQKFFVFTHVDVRSHKHHSTASLTDLCVNVGSAILRARRHGVARKPCCWRPRDRPNPVLVDLPQTNKKGHRKSSKNTTT